MIRARGLGYMAGRTVLADGIDLDIAPGEVLALVGANGAGKSTLLRLLTGELVPTAGSVTLDEVELGEYGPRDLARLRAVLPQALPQVPGLTVGEVVTLGRTPHHRSLLTEEGGVVDDILRSQELDCWRHRRMETLSGGEAQRVHFARGLAQLTGRAPGSRYYFLDEPTSALDLGRQVELLASVSDLATQGWGVVLVVHDLNLAARFAHRIALLHRGRLEAWGPPAEVLRADTVSRAFSTRCAVVPHPVLGHPLVLALGPEESGGQDQKARSASSHSR